MQAYSYSRYGPPEVLEKIEVPTPSPKRNEVLVKVHATTVSAADWRMRSLTMPAGLGWIGRPAIGIFGPRKPVLGTDFSGVIVAVGIDVTQFKVGDAVIGFPGVDLGAHAEFIVMPADGKITFKPENLSHQSAAAVPFGGMTAYDYLINKGKLRKGEKVLIIGASGSVGLASVQIARYLGAKVTGVCSTANAQLVLDSGADEVIDYKTQDFSNQTGQFDVIVDAVGKAPWASSQHALRPGGRMLLIAGKASDMIFGGVKARLIGKNLIAGVATENRNILEAVVKLAADGDFRPHIDACYSFDDMVKAHQHVDTGHKKGNVVVSVHQDANINGQV